MYNLCLSCSCLAFSLNLHIFYCFVSSYSAKEYHRVNSLIFFDTVFLSLVWEVHSFSILFIFLTFLLFSLVLRWIANIWKVRTSSLICNCIYLLANVYIFLQMYIFSCKYIFFACKCISFQIALYVLLWVFEMLPLICTKLGDNDFCSQQLIGYEWKNICIRSASWCFCLGFSKFRSLLDVL